MPSKSTEIESFPQEPVDLEEFALSLASRGATLDDRRGVTIGAHFNQHHLMPTRLVANRLERGDPTKPESNAEKVRYQGFALVPTSTRRDRELDWKRVEGWFDFTTQRGVLRY